MSIAWLRDVDDVLGTHKIGSTPTLRDDGRTARLGHPYPSGIRQYRRPSLMPVKTRRGGDAERFQSGGSTGSHHPFRLWPSRGKMNDGVVSDERDR